MILVAMVIFFFFYLDQKNCSTYNLDAALRHIAISLIFLINCSALFIIITKENRERLQHYFSYMSNIKLCKIS